MSCTPSRPVARLLLSWIGAALLVVALPAAAGKVYQWKDAKGVTHYSDEPPPGEGKARSRTIRNSGAATEEPPPQQAKAVVNTNCTNARSNLKVLQGDQAVGVDADNDGKADRELTAGERANRLQLAEAQIRTFCEIASAPAEGDGA